MRRTVCIFCVSAILYAGIPAFAQNAPALVSKKTPSGRQFIYDLQITQIAPLVIEVNWKCADEKAKACLEYLTPQGKTVKTKWLPASIGARKAGFSSHTRIIEIANPTGIGTYRIKVKARGSRGQRVQTEFSDFVLFGGPLWQLKASSVTSTSCVLQWERFPYPERFATYQLKIADAPSVEIGSIETVSHCLQDLKPKTKYQIELTAKEASDTVLAVPAAVCVTSLSRPPIISNVQGIPEFAGLNQLITVNAQINDDDSSIKKVELLLSGEKEKRVLAQQQFDSPDVPFSFGFSLSQAGAYELTLKAYDEASVSAVVRKCTVLEAERPRISFEKISSPAYANRQHTLEINVLNKEKLSGVLSLDLAWGDGMIQSIDIPTAQSFAEKANGQEKASEKKSRNTVNVAHTYKSEGTFTVTARLSSKAGNAMLASEPITVSIPVQALSPSAELLKKTGKTNLQQFHIKAVKGSYSIASWSLSFGDETPALTGEGDVEKDIEHNFGEQTGRIPGTDTIKPAYEVKFTVKDTNNNTVNRILAVEVTSGSSDPSAPQPFPANTSTTQPSA